MNDFLSFRLPRMWRIIWAIVLKDFRDTYRFKLFLSTRFFTPVLNMASFFFVYAAVFTHVNDVGYIQKNTYVLYLVTGFLAYNFFRMPWNATRLNQEKYMLTLEGTLLTPLHRMYILAGKAVRAFLELIVDTSIFIVFLLLLHPRVDWLLLGIGILGLMCLYIIWISIDFIISGIQLSEEGVASLISEYVPRVIMFISAVYYPVETLPIFLRTVSYVNPVYHAVMIFRSAFYLPDAIANTPLSLGYLVGLAIVMPFVAVWLFDWMYQKFGIKGY